MSALHRRRLEAIFAEDRGPAECRIPESELPAAAAGRDLILQAQIRVEAIRSTIWTALKFLAKKAFESALSKLISVAITLLAALFGFKI